MMPTYSPWPTEIESARLTAELLAGQASAAGEIATEFLSPLIGYLRHKFPNVDPELCETAAEDAILILVRGETNYDVNKLELGAFLRVIGFRKLAKLHRKHTRRSREISLESVAEPSDEGNYSQWEEETLSWDHPQLVGEMATFNPTDTQLLNLMRAGVRSHAEFAPVLGLASSTPADLAAEVKRNKDRIKTRLKRAVRGEE
jgi:hypothetical protein